MRVIAGVARSLPLKTVPGDQTRPTTDRIKETLFNMLHASLPGSRFLDLFSGSGGIGIEALSRGAEKAVFVDSAKEAENVILSNLAFTHLQEKAWVIRADVLTAISRIEAVEKEPFHFIFMDPPYDQGLEFSALKRLHDSPIVSKDTVLIYEASMKADLSEAERLGYEILKDKQYKTNRHVWLKKAE